MPAKRARELLEKAGFNHDGTKNSNFTSPTITFRDGTKTTVDQWTNRNNTSSNTGGTGTVGTRSGTAGTGTPLGDKHHRTGYYTSQNPYGKSDTPSNQVQALQKHNPLVMPKWVDAKGGGGMEGWLVNGTVYSNRDRAMREAERSQHIPNLNQNFGMKMEDRTIGNNRYTVPEGTRKDWKPGEDYFPGMYQAQLNANAQPHTPGYSNIHEPSGAEFHYGRTFVYTDPRSGRQTTMGEPQMQHILQMYAGQGQDISGLVQEIPGRGTRIYNDVENTERLREWNRRPENISPVTGLQYGTPGDKALLMKMYGIDPEKDPAAARQLWYDYHGIGYVGQDQSPFVQDFHPGQYNNPTPVADKYWDREVRYRAEGMNHLGQRIDADGYRVDSEGNRIIPEDMWGSRLGDMDNEGVQRMRDAHLGYDAPKIGDLLANFNQGYQAPEGIFKPGQHAGQTEFGPTDAFIDRSDDNYVYQRALQHEIDAGMRTPDGERVEGITTQNTLQGPTSGDVQTMQATDRQPITGEPQPTPEGVKMPETSGGFSGTTVKVYNPDGTLQTGYIGMDNRTYLSDGSRPIEGSAVQFNDGRMYGVVPSGTQRTDGTTITGKEGVGGYRFTPEQVAQAESGNITNEMDNMITDFVNSIGAPPSTTYQDLYDWLSGQQPDHDFSNVGVDNSFLQVLGGMVGAGYGGYAVGSASSASEDDESVTHAGGASGPVRESMGVAGVPPAGSLYR